MTAEIPCELSSTRTSSKQPTTRRGSKSAMYSCLVVVVLQAMRERLTNLSADHQEPTATDSERVRRLSVCLHDLRRASRDWRLDQSPLAVRSADRRRSVVDLLGNMDEAFSTLSWLAEYQ